MVFQLQTDGGRGGVWPRGYVTAVRIAVAKPAPPSGSRSRTRAGSRPSDVGLSGSSHSDEYGREVSDRGEVHACYGEREDRRRDEDGQINPSPRPRDPIGEHGRHPDEEVAHPDIAACISLEAHVLPDGQIEQPFADIRGRTCAVNPTVSQRNWPSQCSAGARNTVNSRDTVPRFAVDPEQAGESALPVDL